MSISNHIKIKKKTSATIEMDSEAVELFVLMVEYAKLACKIDENNGANRDKMKSFICHIENYLD